MWWIIGLVLLAAVSITSSMIFRRIRKTALVIVHPWNLGLSEDEMRETMIKSFLNPNDERNKTLIKDHISFYEIIEQYIYEHLYGWYVLFEESHKAERSLLRLKTLFVNSYYMSMLHELLRWQKVCNFLTIETVFGKAKPANNVNWPDVAQALHKCGIRKIQVIGCYLGTKDGIVVYDPTLYGNYCVNEAFSELRDSGLFDSVEVLQDLCYHGEATEKQGQVYLFPPRPRRVSKTRDKKNKKKKKR